MLKLPHPAVNFRDGGNPRALSTLCGPADQRGEDRAIALVASRQASGHRPAADQQYRRHHQLCDDGIRAAVACLRFPESGRQTDRCPDTTAWRRGLHTLDGTRENLRRHADDLRREQTRGFSRHHGWVEFGGQRPDNRHPVGERLFQPGVNQEDRRRLKLATGASYRFERGVDPDGDRQCDGPGGGAFLRDRRRKLRPEGMDIYDGRKAHLSLDLRNYPGLHLIGMELDADRISPSCWNSNRHPLYPERRGAHCRHPTVLPEVDYRSEG